MFLALVLVSALLLSSIPALAGESPDSGKSLAEARQALEQQLVGMPGFVGIAHSEERGEIVVFLENEQAKGIVSNRFEGHLVQREVTGRFQALSTQVAETIAPSQANQVSPVRTGIVRPLIGGISVSAYVAGEIWAGTLGMVTYDNKILSNAHVIAIDPDNNFLPAGTPIIQPGSLDGGTPDNQVGELENYIPIIFSPYDEPDPVVNYADAAIATIDPEVEGLSGWQFGGGSDYQVSGTTTVTPGDTVRKSGRTTDVTENEVYITNASVWVSYDDQAAYFVDQIAVYQPFSQPGDSGSVVDKDGEFVGLVFAGGDTYSIVCKAEYIIDELGIAVEPTEVEQPDITVSPPSFDVTLPSNTIQNYTLTIGNDGDATLTYSISDRGTTSGTSQGDKAEMFIQLARKVLETPSESRPVEPRNTTQVQGSWQNIMTEDFEGVFPGIWDVFCEEGSTDAYWGKDNHNPHGGSYSVFCAKDGTAGVDPPSDYPNNVEAFVVYGPFSLAGATDAELSFYWWYDTELQHDYVECIALVDEDNYVYAWGTGNSQGWKSQSLDLGSLCGQPEVWVAFIFTSDGAVTDKGAFVDDVVLRKYVSGANNPPNTPSSPSPANHAIGVSMDADLSWTGGDPDVGDTVTYDVYFGTSATPPLVFNDQSATTYEPGTLNPNTKYYWKIIATDNHASSTTGTVWDFTTAEDCPWLDENPKSGSVPAGGSNDITVTINTTGLTVGNTYTAEIIIANNDPDENPKVVPVTLHVAPGANNPPNMPTSPSPANHATGIPTNADLSWTGGDPDAGDTVTYDVYFGTSSTPPLVSNDQSGTTYDPGTLAYNTKYYWKIVATDNHGASTTGLLWDFSTVAAPSATATRTLPMAVEPGAEFDVGIEASGCGSFGQVRETLPDGFTYVSVSDPGDILVSMTNGEVWFTFLGDSISFNYTVQAPTVEDTYTFAGAVLDDDSVPYPVGGDTEVKVGAVVLESIATEPTEVSLGVAGGRARTDMEQLAVTATYSDASTADVTDAADYESDDQNVAAVSTTGLITAISAGTATISVSYTEGEITRTVEVLVTVVFDPWLYDMDESGVIEKNEALLGIQDYFGGEITKMQVLEVLQLYFAG